MEVLGFAAGGTVATRVDAPVSSSGGKLSTKVLPSSAQVVTPALYSVRQVGQNGMGYLTGDADQGAPGLRAGSQGSRPVLRL